MKLTTAIISSSPREVATKFGQRTVIDAVRTDTSEKIAIWRPPNDRYVSKLGKDDRVSIAINEKGKITLVEEESPASFAPPPLPERSLTLSLSKKKEIASYITQMKDLYNFCLQQADSLGAINEDRRAIATTLFISAQKKFNF